MFENDQTYFKNLAVWTPFEYQMCGQFSTFCMNVLIFFASSRSFDFYYFEFRKKMVNF